MTLLVGFLIGAQVGIDMTVLWLCFKAGVHESMLENLKDKS